MIWQVPVSAAILLFGFVAPFMTKRMPRPESRAQQAIYVYFFMSFYSLVLAGISGQFSPKPILIAVLLLGICNSLSFYCYWRAIDAHLSLAIFFLPISSFIGIGMGYFLLDESGLVYVPSVQMGITILLIAIAAISLDRLLNQSTLSLTTQSLKLNKRTFSLWIATVSIVDGIVIFSRRYFSTVHDVQRYEYLLLHYLGSILGAMIIAKFLLKEETRLSLSRKEISSTAALGAVYWLIALFIYWSFELAPIIIVEPVFRFSSLIFPLLVGLFVFKEGRSLRILGKISIPIGVAGVFILLLSF